MKHGSECILYYRVFYWQPGQNCASNLRQTTAIQLAPNFLQLLFDDGTSSHAPSARKVVGLHCTTCKDADDRHAESSPFTAHAAHGLLYSSWHMRVRNSGR